MTHFCPVCRRDQCGHMLETVFEALRSFAKTPLDLGIARFADDVISLMSRDGYLPPGCTQDECDDDEEGQVSCPFDDPGCDGGEGDCHDGCERPAPPPTFYSVALVLHDRAYGGPEEGGWYYETYQLETNPPIECVPIICFTEEAAKEAAEKIMEVNIAALKLNEGRREISSVLSEGLYEARIFGGFPRSEPQTRPHYE